MKCVVVLVRTRGGRRSPMPDQMSAPETFAKYLAAGLSFPVEMKTRGRKARRCIPKRHCAHADCRFFRFPRCWEKTSIAKGRISFAYASKHFAVSIAHGPTSQTIFQSGRASLNRRSIGAACKTSPRCPDVNTMAAFSLCPPCGNHLANSPIVW